MTEQMPRPADGRAVTPVQVPSLAELTALTHRLHALEGRHTTRVNGHTVRTACPPGETRCFVGTAKELAARAAQMRARIAALTGGSDRRRPEPYEIRREQLNRWHADDRSAEHTEQDDESYRSQR